MFGVIWAIVWLGRFLTSFVFSYMFATLDSHLGGDLWEICGTTRRWDPARRSESL